MPPLDKTLAQPKEYRPEEIARTGWNHASHGGVCLAKVWSPMEADLAGFLYANSLSLALFAFFLLSLVGQILTGWHALDQDLELHHLPSVTLLAYFSTGHFISALFENWESEFLQMSGYVLLTIFLRQKGSPESKPLVDDEQEEAGSRSSDSEDAGPMWPMSGGIGVRWLYANSLSIALILLFVLSFALHLVGSTRQANEEAARHGRGPVSAIEHLGDAEFWYESFQNWQSEFFAMGVFIVLGVYLRQRGSPESKPVAAPQHPSSS